MNKYPQVLINVKAAKQVDIEKLEKVQAAKRDIEKKLGHNGRILLRASGTEPLIRVMAEGIDEDDVNHCAQQLAEVVKKAVTV